jgi:hypothetical protein
MRRVGSCWGQHDTLNRNRDAPACRDILVALTSGVFVHIPKRGVVGVGTVKETMQPVQEFNVSVNGQTVPILEAPLQAPSMDAWVKDSSERWEYLVRVEWIKTVSRDEAIWEKGMFANQNTVVRLRDPFTLERITEAFGLADEED